METYEWGLVLFTVLSQAAVGGFILTLCMRLRNKDAALDGIYRKSNLTLFAVSVVAMLASLFHLGRPLHALNALGNLGSSWLSREIVLAGGFVGLLFLSILFDRKPGVRQAVDWLTALVGVGVVASTATVYSVTIVPQWQGYQTYVAFFGTAAFLGAALAAGLMLVFGHGTKAVAENLQMLIKVAVVAVAIEVVVAALAGSYSPLFMLRWALALIGGLVPFLLVGRRLTAGQVPAGLVYGATLFVLAGEIVGRYLFYATGTPIGIG